MARILNPPYSISGPDDVIPRCAAFGQRPAMPDDGTIYEAGTQQYRERVDIAALQIVHGIDKRTVERAHGHIVLKTAQRQLQKKPKKANETKIDIP